MPGGLVTLAASAISEGCMHVVIGSGPAGVACAQALLRQGKTVRMLDAGLTLEPECEALIRQLATTPQADWRDEPLARLREGMDATAKGIVLKRVYGSDFPYREVETHFPANYGDTGLRPSFALGGLSNVWGSAMLPYRAGDLHDWPISTDDLAPHYRAVLEFTGLSARGDDLALSFPLHADRTPALALSRQASALHARLTRHRAALGRAGVHFGQARLAVQAAAGPGEAGCTYCGLCMYGCPYRYIYNSAFTVEEMRRHPAFSYAGDRVVTRLQEENDRVLIEGHHRESREPWRENAQRVFLAAGVIPTAQLLATPESPVTIQDSQYFLFPLLSFRGAGDVRKEALHTLSQLFLEFEDRALSPYMIHLQVYSYNDLIGQALRGSLGPLAFPPLVRALETRLLIVQGYLHSTHSAKIELTLRQNRLEMKTLPNPSTRPIVHRLLRKLTALSPRLGAVPLSPLLQIAPAGRGFHSGGSFPMAHDPVGHQSDLLGRLPGWSRVHAVDASVLPTIPATTITFSAMANAHRIGSEAARL